ncbi:MAG: DNA repair protein RadC [Gammaproteobacteria bacterium]|nr:DNA repair protein RadC [Gammaproteobacteria bacterium]
MSLPKTAISRRNPVDQARQRLFEFGAAQLTDAELLAVLLGSFNGSADPLGVAEDLLGAAGGLRGLGANAESLGRSGIGPARIARVKAAVELGRRRLEGPLDRRRPFTDAASAARCFRARLADLGYEVFSCLYLDTRHRMIRHEPLFRGTIDGAAVYPREIVKMALRYGAAALILGHNHPSGDCEPSEADRNITIRVAKALALVDIRLLDHVVVSAEGHVSMAERGWI